MAADGGSVIFWGRPLTRWEKKDRGLKMAVDDGSVFFWGKTADQEGKKDRGRSKTKTTRRMLEMWLLMKTTRKKHWLKTR